ncbi:MAG: hypothetical protein ACP5NZ_03600 [Nanobdellota archaeon]
MKRGIYILAFFLVIILGLSMISAGSFNSFWDKISGKATSANVGLNITVTGGTAPRIIAVYNETSTTVASGVNEGPAPSYVPLVFRVEDADGIANLNNATATVNFSKSGETTRTNSSCIFERGKSTATQANYSCNVTMWWYDGPGTWSINVYITDLSGNSAYNSTVKNLTVGATDGLLANVTSLTWSSIAPGASNTEASQFMGINNTGNRYRSVLVNSSDLLGETTYTKALGATNFSVKNAAGCEGTPMVNRTDTNITSATLPHGNYTKNDGTAQENIYFCLETSNSDLTPQAYSTQALGAWIVKVG